MKKILVLILLILSIFTKSEAQQFGARAGFNFAKHVADAVGPTTVKSGVNICALADFKLWQELYFRPELMFVSKGAKHEIGNYIVNQNYFEIPLLMAVKVKINNDWKLDFQSGPFLAFGLSGKYKKIEGSYDGYIPQAFKKDGNDGYKRFDFGWNVGAGINFYHYYVGMGYDISFLELTDNEKYREKNAVLMINFGYNF